MTHAGTGLPRELDVSTYTAGRPTVTGEHAGECPDSRLTVVHDYFRDQFRRLRHQLATEAGWTSPCRGCTTTCQGSTT